MERAVPSTPWHDDPGVWEALAPILWTAETVGKAPAEVDQVVALAGLRPGERVLDMPCGVARHAVELARRGLRVTGVDLSPAYLERARAAAADAGVALELHHGDMRDFRRAGAFDVALNLWTSFGYFEDPADDERTAANLAASLRPGGRLVMELVPKETICRTFRARDWRELPGGALLLEERRLSLDLGWISNTWRLWTGDRWVVQRFGHRLYSATELRRLLLAAGFATVECFGGLAGGPFDVTSNRLALVARTPA